MLIFNFNILLIYQHKMSEKKHQLPEDLEASLENLESESLSLSGQSDSTEE